MTSTQHSRLEAALIRHGCTKLKTLPSGWTQWSEGDLIEPRPSEPRKFFYLGRTNAFRHGPTRGSSAEWPKLRFRLLCEDYHRPKLETPVHFIDLDI